MYDIFLAILVLAFLFYLFKSNIILQRIEKYINKEFKQKNFSKSTSSFLGYSFLQLLHGLIISFFLFVIVVLSIFSIFDMS